MLLSAMPAWFEANATRDRIVSGLARVPNTIWSASGLGLDIALIEYPRVRETVPGTHLPRSCPDRHLFDDSTFCLGLKPCRVDNVAAARDWWWALEQYIQCQSVASETGLWPLGHGLDHGKAGAKHAQAIGLALKLGILDEYLAIHCGERQAFSVEVRERLYRNRDFRNLLEVERERRGLLAEYVVRAGRSNRICCGSMRDCPFPKATIDIKLKSLLPVREEKLDDRLLSSVSSICISLESSIFSVEF